MYSSGCPGGGTSPPQPPLLGEMGSRPITDVSLRPLASGSPSPQGEGAGGGGPPAWAARIVRESEIALVYRPAIQKKLIASS